MFLEVIQSKRSLQSGALEAFETQVHPLSGNVHFNRLPCILPLIECARNILTHANHLCYLCHLYTEFDVVYSFSPSDPAQHICLLTK